MVAVKLNQVAPRGTAKIFMALAAGNAVTCTLSLPYMVAVPNKYCIHEGTAQVRKRGVCVHVCVSVCLETDAMHHPT